MSEDRAAQLAEIESLLAAKGLTVADLRDALLSLDVYADRARERAGRPYTLEQIADEPGIDLEEL